MRQRDAIDMFAGSAIAALGPTTWADLGCGDGTFTVALASLLAPGSTIHAMDRDSSVLREVPSAHNGVRIRTHVGDFTHPMWPFAEVDGILMANSLHYVDDQAAFIAGCERHMKESRRFLIVEYDSDESSPWVPYPVNRATLTSLFTRVGLCSIEFLRSRRSLYRRAALYSAMITCIAPRGTAE
jgi:ubiquinone/menaquinone biosynthesis C-methylase UbiE